ncbi:hypothetical protein F4553_003188 [Allocatelliglobosispora scoriae]|uniref:DUF4233 domain-containing protein n=1 Tax=Allocatelliglobosispora scoriae TaxID=643052 RepID=A0A841BRI5_9ACTN|nr:DUF4233 domain-containing protein [Allocatelliglobosispora scoriae]MBB5869809.1 hypothetical protein [Allocatelliglobosispora scoriae]
MTNSTETTPDEPQIISGLRNPERAVRGLAAGTLVLEGITLLLAIQPVRMLGGSTAAVVTVAVTAVVAFLLSGMMGRRWAWHVASALQVVLVGAIALNWAIATVGVIFGLVWIYVLRVRKRILG